MRIVDVNEYYCPTGGGVRTYVNRKMRLLADLGHELIVVAPGHENRLEHRPCGGRVFWVAAPRAVRPKLWYVLGRSPRDSIAR